MKHSSEVNVYSLSGERISSTFEYDNDVEFRSFRYEDDEEYRKVLTSAAQKGIAIIIDGDEPTEDELLKIKEIYDKNGSVKVFRRKRRNAFRDEISIKPSRFTMIRGLDQNSSLIKDSVCGHIAGLIRDLEVT